MGPAPPSEPGLWGEGTEPELNVPVESGVRLMGEGEAEPELSAVHEEALAIRAWEVSSTSFIATTKYASLEVARNEASHRDCENREEGGILTAEPVARVFRVSGRCHAARRLLQGEMEPGPLVKPPLPPVNPSLVPLPSS